MSEDERGVEVGEEKRPRWLSLPFSPERSALQRSTVRETNTGNMSVVQRLLTPLVGELEEVEEEEGVQARVEGEWLSEGEEEACSGGRSR